MNSGFAVMQQYLFGQVWLCCWSSEAGHFKIWTSNTNPNPSPPTECSLKMELQVITSTYSRACPLDKGNNNEGGGGWGIDQASEVNQNTF